MRQLNYLHPRQCRVCQALIYQGFYCNEHRQESIKASHRRHRMGLGDLWPHEPKRYDAVNEMYDKGEYQFIADGLTFRKDARLTRQAIREALEDGAVLPTEYVIPVGGKQQIMVEAI